jgi:hypothetical protein
MEDKLMKFAEKIKGSKSTYCAGGMQARKQPNRWRKDLAEFLEPNNIKVVNPVEDNKDIFSDSMMGFKSEGIAYTLDDLLKTDPKKRAMMFKQTEENDIHFMESVDFQIFYLDDSIGFGTMTEFRENFDTIKKPTIIIRTIPVNKLAHWIEWRWLSMLESGNAIEFKNFSEMRQFFVSYLGYKK